MDATVVIGAATALVGALLGSLGAPLLQGRLADRTSLRNERMVLYAQAMLHMHILSEQLESLLDPHDYVGMTAAEFEQRAALAQVPDQTTARMRLIAQEQVRDAWLELVRADEGLKFAVAQDDPGFRQEGTDPIATLPKDWAPVARLRAAIGSFEQVCRTALRLRD